MATMKVDADILIIGAGMAGAATAYHLARRTDLGVLIVEQEETAGVHSSGRNAAIIREHADEPALQQLLSDGAHFLRLGELAEYEQRGLMVMRNNYTHKPAYALQNIYCRVMSLLCKLSRKNIVAVK